MPSPARAPRRSRPTATVPSALVLLIAWGWLITQWPTRGLWYDETVNAYFAGQSWASIWEWCTRIDNQMPGHFVLLKLWGSAVGTSEFALRAFSAVCILLTLAGIVALGRRLGQSRTAGWLSVAAFAVTQSALYAAFEVRPYALLLALWTGASVVFWDLWQHTVEQQKHPGRQTPRLRAIYLVLALALVYTHYTAWLALAAHAVFAVLRTWQLRSRQGVRLLAWLAVGGALGYTPWVLALAGRDVRGGTAYADRVTPRAALDVYADFYAYGQHHTPADAPDYALAMLLVVVLAAGIWWIVQFRSVPKRRSPCRVRGILATLLVLVPLLGLIMMVYAVQAKLSGRHGWAIWPGLALVIGMGLATLRRWRWRAMPVWAGALLVLWLPTQANLHPIYNSYFREAFAYIDHHAQPGDVILLRDGTLFTAAGYYDASLPTAGMPPEKLTDVNRFLFLNQALAQVSALVEAHGALRVWVVAWQGHIMDPQNLTAAILNTIGERQPLPDSTGFGDIEVALYKRTAYPRAVRDRITAHPFEASFPANGPALVSAYLLAESPVAPGAVLDLHTWWQRGARIQPEARVSVRLYQGDEFVTQIDQPPAGPAFGQDLWPVGEPVLGRYLLPVPADLAPGPAKVRIVFYDIPGSFEPFIVTVADIVISN